jgi:sigma-B regulation protein RsbU (phosphoserine phosphatase)
VLVFIAVGVLLSNVLGALLGMGALLAGGELKHLADVLPFFFSWVMGNGLPCLVLGVPLLQALSPLVMDSPFFCKQWWGGSRPLRWSGSRLEDLPIAARLVLGFSIAGVLPILIVAATETVLLPDIADRISDLVLPVMLNLSIFLSLIVSGRVAQSISRRVGVLTEGAQHLGGGDLTYRVAVEGADEIGHLAQTFNQMAEDLTASREELRRTTAERERYQRELEIAHDIQQSFLPQTLPEVPGLDLAAHNIPARQVGGDFYDVIPLQGGRWGLLVADVSDKGVPAALFMALSRSLVRAYSLEYNNVPEALRAFNAFVAADNPSGMFVTLFYATLEPETGRLAYINAGHNPPVLVRGSEHQVILLRAHGIALGIWSEAKLEEHPVQLEPGDVVVLYTDGVTEAFDPDGEMFELERLIEVTRAHPTASARELVEAIEAEVATFTRGAPQSDDITLMVMRCCR